MSTRGTYTIKQKEYDGRIRTQHFYIHHDNYESGSALYFKMFVEHPNQRGLSICRFIRSIVNCEITEDPKHHGDTEFHYELDEELNLLAYTIQRDWKTEGKCSQTCFYNGDLAGYLNKYLEPIPNSWGEPVKADYRMFKNGILSKHDLEQLYIKEVAQGLDYISRGHNGNADYNFKTAYAIHKELSPQGETPNEILFACDILSQRNKNFTASEYLERFIIKQ